MSLPSTLLLIFLLLQVSASRPSNESHPAKQHVTFAQLTDAHVFDDGWKTEGSEPYQEALDDRTALHWAVEQVNELAARTPIDFVVYTGDFGVQNVFFSNPQCNGVPFKSEPGLPPFSSDMAVMEFSIELDRLSVHDVFVTPGNNDIIDENAADNPRFECFIAQLQARLHALPRHIHLEVLRADKAVNIAGIRLAGLNTASFKKAENYDAACKAGSPHAAEAAEAGCPIPQLQMLARLLDRDGGAPLLLFTHVPDLLDPFRHTPSWELDLATRNDWLKLAAKQQLVGIFAGHFHSNRPDLYATNSGTRGLFVDARDGEKTWVAPPLAGKNQRDGKPQARGFMLVDLDLTQGKFAVNARAVWYPTATPSSGESTMTQLHFFWLVVGVIAISGFFGGLLNYLLYKEEDLLDPSAKQKPLGRQGTAVLVAGNLVLGVGAAFLVPLFLHVIGSDLFTTLSGTSGEEPRYPQLLVIAGFCLVASMSAKTFIKSVSERVLRKAENAEKLAGEAKHEVSQAQAVLDRLKEPDPDRIAEKMESTSEGSLSPNDYRVLKALSKGPYVLRTSAGIAQERGIEDSDRALAKLRDLGLTGIISMPGPDGKDRTYWYITGTGVAVLGHRDNIESSGAPSEGGVDDAEGK